MKAIRTQFDTGTFSGAVATPTCSSCCCCCCCAATMSSASVIGAVGSFRAAKRAGLSPAQRVLAIIAALVIPWLPATVGVVVLDPLLSLLSGESLVVWLSPVVVMVAMAYVSYFGLFSWLQVRSPGLRALAVTVFLGGAFMVELILGGRFVTSSGTGWWPYLRIAAAIAAGFVFLMLALKGKRGRSGTDVVFGLPPKGAAAPPPGRPPGGPWPQS